MNRRRAPWVVVLAVACGGGSTEKPPDTSDRVPPVVLSPTPGDGAVGIARDAVVEAVFSEAIAEPTIAGSTFTVRQGATPVAGEVAYDPLTRTARFTPAAPLADLTVYIARLSTGTPATSSSSPSPR